MQDWIDKAADGIMGRWEQWHEDAGRAATVEQNSDAGEHYLRTCIVNYLRHMQANHSQGRLPADKRLDKACSALKIINTWATFTFRELPAGHALVPEQVAELCQRTLKEIDQ